MFRKKGKTSTPAGGGNGQTSKPSDEPSGSKGYKPEGLRKGKAQDKKDKGPQPGGKQPQQGRPQTEGAGGEGPPQPGEFGKQPQQGQPQLEGAWRKGPPQPGEYGKQPQQGQQQTEGAWRKGPPQPGEYGKQPQQGQQQTEGAWRKGPPQPVEYGKQPQQGRPQTEGAWRKGPPQPGGKQPQTEGAWRKGPPQPGEYGKQPQQGLPQTEGAWGEGPPQPGEYGRQPQQGRPQTEGAWRKGPPQPGEYGRQPQQGRPQTEGAWRKGPPQPGGKQSQTEGAWRKGPPQPGEYGKQPQQGLPQTEGAWGKGPPQPGQQLQKTSPETEAFFTPSKRIIAPTKSGKEIVVATNFFPLRFFNPNITVIHYNVVIDPEKPVRLLRKVWNKYVSLMYPRRVVAFDGKKNAYSRGSLLNGRLSSEVTAITIINPDNKREKEFKVSIEEVGTLNFSCFKDYRTKMLQDHSLKIPEAEINTLDILMSNWANENLVKCNRSFFPLASSSVQTMDLSKKLCLRMGYFQSAFFGYKPYLNFDIAHKAFYKACPVLEIVGCFRNVRTNEINLDEMTKFLRSTKVEYQLPNDPKSFKVFRINKLVDSAERQFFKREDGTQITVAQYFSREKKCNLRHPDLPLLWVGPTTSTIYLPMEFCKIAQDQAYVGVMDPYEVREMIKLTVSNASIRQKNTYKLFEEANINSQSLVKEFELQVSDCMEKVPARVLDPPGLQTSRGVKVNEGTWKIQDFLEPVTLNKWCILNLDKQVQKQYVIELQNLIQSKGNSLNMRIANPAKNYIEADPFRISELKKVFSQLKNMEIIFVIISEAKGVYSKVKTICETQEGILTQCVKSRTVRQDPRKLLTTVENILLKVNAKLGGKNHKLDMKSTPRCLEGYTMIVGADVTHPSPGMSIPSVAAVTVSCDPNNFQYQTSTRVQPKGEMIKDLEELMKIYVKKFYEIRKQYPEKIIFFRDGVSEGEMQKVLKGELSAVKRACNPYCQPKITFIVVQKRHHTRFYPTRPEDAQGKNFNVPVGTCVDSEIVHPREFEFYIVSHLSIQGTARPTKYRLLYDDNKLTDDELEKLSFYLCHLFSRCNRSVSYPSPTYNAHLSAARVRTYLEGLNLTTGKENVEDIQKIIVERISSDYPMFYV